MISKTSILIFCCAFYLVSCKSDNSSHEEMLQLLTTAKQNAFDPKNNFNPVAKLEFMDSLLTLGRLSVQKKLYCEYLKATSLLELGEEERAIELLESIRAKYSDDVMNVKRDLAIAYLRQGERANCITNHASASCILPIKGMGIHSDKSGSQKAIELFQELIHENPSDYESIWLLNIAYMTIGGYPEQVPSKFLLKGMEGDNSVTVDPFVDIAADLKLDIKSMAGGSITEDFNNDNYLDLMVSSMFVTEQLKFFKNNGDGTFTDATEKAGLKGITGGLNIIQADYNNDGYKDVLILRGAWQGDFGNEPNSLLRNNGDGTFTDVTTESGILSFHPTQTATWNDFNNDGWLDVFIGNEFSKSVSTVHPCELFMNNGNGTFREVALQTNCKVLKFVKGVTSGDYDKDGFKDIFISTMGGERILLKNTGFKEKEIWFEDVTSKAGLAAVKGNSFPTWFWDYDNDGWLDIFACDYSFNTTLAVYAATEKLGIKNGNPEKMLLYHNNGDGTFTNVAEQLGLTTNVFAMGSNFGDIDNDGFLDMYLGTGNPNFQSIVPNKMFKNMEGKGFADVTSSARVGHLQKGHGVSFGDMDNDGDQDIHIKMGGPYPGDAYQNSFFLNPGQGTNNWITINLEGKDANRDAIGSSLILSIKENGVSRKIYRDVNSGGSFGSSPLRREIGVGQATIIDSIQIIWHGGGPVQVFHDVPVNQFIKISEGSSKVEILSVKTVKWNLPDNRLCLATTR